MLARNLLVLLCLGLASADILLTDLQDYKDHPCIRPCVNNGKPMTCKYDLTIEWYYTLSKACYNCPHNKTDCDRPHCIAADGNQRGILAVNRMMPGPAIHVCENDNLEVTVHNRMQNGEGTSIHFHGHHMKENPYMDGVSHLTQCEIEEWSSFMYRFPATTPGTHYWHTHSGLQRADGIYGAYIARQAPKREPNNGAYDHDLPEHTMIVMDWMKDVVVNNYGAHQHSHVMEWPDSILIDGKGPNFKFLPPGSQETSPALTPRAVFRVGKGKKYRFRMIGNGIMNCPITVSIDQHKLTLIATDGAAIEAVTVDFFNIFPGETWDMVVDASQPVGNYWWKFKGLLDCVFKKVHQAAILRYDGAPDEDPSGGATYSDMDRTGLGVNPLNKKHSDTDRQVASLVGKEPAKPTDPIAKEKPDRTLYFRLGFSTVDSLVSHQPSLYPVGKVPSARQSFTPQMNYISLIFPDAPPLSQLNDVPASAYCNAGTVNETYCKTKYCECVHVEFVKLNEVVEIVVVDEGILFNNNHPMHMHGYHYRVVAQDKVGDSVTLEQVKQMDREGKIKRNLTHGILKDTVNVPDGGYVILRLLADAPGLWAFHCHLAFHAEVGMAAVIAVGDLTKLPPPPPGFPKCGNFKYKHLTPPTTTTIPTTTTTRTYSPECDRMSEIWGTCGATTACLSTLTLTVVLLASVIMNFSK